MPDLRDLPSSPELDAVTHSIEADCRREIREYIHLRTKQVKQGKESRRFAALLLDKYGQGMSRTLHIAGIPSSVQHDIDRAVRELDPDFEANQSRRWVQSDVDLTLKE